MLGVGALGVLLRPSPNRRRRPSLVRANPTHSSSRPPESFATGEDGENVRGSVRGEQRVAAGVVWGFGGPGTCSCLSLDGVGDVWQGGAEEAQELQSFDNFCLMARDTMEVLDRWGTWHKPSNLGVPVPSTLNNLFFFVIGTFCRVKWELSSA